MGAVFNRVTLSATEQKQIAWAGANVGEAGWELNFAGTSWTGSVVLKQNTAPPGKAVSLSSVAYFNATTGALVAAGTAITSGGSFIVANTGLDLWLDYTHTAGSVQVTAMAGAGQFGGVTVQAGDISAGTFGSFTGDTGTYAFATNPLAFGASPPASGAIRIDAASYSNIVLRVTNGASACGFIYGTPFVALGVSGGASSTLFLGANNLDKWRINNEAAGTSTLQSESAITRIVGGSTNGLAIRNSGNTRDNLLIADNGATVTMTDGTNTVRLLTVAASGEVPAGGRADGGSAGSRSFIIAPNGTGTAGDFVKMMYYDGTVNRSALEVANVASGFGNLALMKSGGYITQYGTSSADASSSTVFRKAVTAFTDTVAKTVFTVTIPNAAHAGTVKLTVQARIGAGGAIGAGEAMHSISYDISFVRTAGVNAVAVLSSAYGSAAAAVAGATTCAAVATCGAVSGAVGATNTIDIQVAITKGGGASDNHTALCFAELINAAATGITIA